MIETLRRIAFVLLCLMPLLLATTRAGADIAASLIAALFLWRSALQKEWRWTAEAEMRVLTALWLSLLVTSCLSPFNRIEAFGTSILWARFVLLYAAARYWLLANRRRLEIAGKIAAITLLPVAFDAGWQYVTGTSLSGHPMFTGTRLTGPLSKANVGGYLLRIGLPVAGLVTYLLIEAGRARRLWAATAATVAVMTIIVLSGERSSALLMLLGVGIIGFTLFVSHPKLRLWVLIGGAGVAALVAALVATQPLVQMRMQYLVQQLDDFWHTPYGQMYLAAFDLGMRHPLTGTGAHQFFAACNSIMAERGITYCDIHPHNIYMEWLAAGGVAGLLLFALAMACLARQLARAAEYGGAAVALTAFAYGGYAALTFPFIVTQSAFANWPGILFWYSMALVMSIHRMRDII
ncbi:MAG: O-antigen ligase family protein [Pseudomonadota bacterium]|nr:O-antigen ligase family protein [Pseudomonadota bacterium]MDE3037282.1 O-antigen ligase family protein [Pseudomonadota bacterium]